MKRGSIGIGLIGTGYMGRCHAAAYSAVSAVLDPLLRPRLLVLCDTSVAHAERSAAQFGFARATTDWREVIADPQVELVSITTPTALHCEMALAALQAGKHVYCEKPMALCVADAQAMADAAKKADRRTLLGYAYLKNPLLLHARRMVREGRLGKIFGFRGMFDEDWMAEGTLPFGWRMRRAEGGPGAISDMGSHLISIAQFLVGPLEAVCAAQQIVHPRRPLADAPGEWGRVENDDISLALLRFSNGALGQMATSRVGWGPKNRLAWELQGTRGTLCLDQERMNELRWYDAETEAACNGFRTVRIAPEHPPYDRFCPVAGHGLGFNELKLIELHHLLEAIAAGTPADPDFSVSLEIERVIDAIERSAAEERWIRLDSAGGSPAPTS